MDCNGQKRNLPCDNKAPRAFHKCPSICTSSLIAKGRQRFQAEKGLPFEKSQENRAQKNIAPYTESHTDRVRGLKTCHSLSLGLGRWRRMALASSNSGNEKSITFCRELDIVKGPAANVKFCQEKMSPVSYTHLTLPTILLV